MSKQENRIIAAFASGAKRLITLHRWFTVLRWVVTGYFFYLADTFIQGSLMLAGGVWSNVLITLPASFVATEIAGELAKRVSERLKLGEIATMVLATVSMLFGVAVLFIPLGNLAGGWLQALIWAVGFLISGTGWIVAIEQIERMASPKNTPPPTTCERCSGG